MTALTIVERERLIDRTTEHYKAAVAAGFTFDMPVVIGREGAGRLVPIVSYPFQCVCGKREIFSNMMTDPSMLRDTRLDVARELERLGSFSVEHLREDGYSDSDIERIRWPFDMMQKVRDLERKLAQARAGVRD